MMEEGNMPTFKENGTFLAVLGPSQPWLFTRQFSDAQEISFGYFNDTMSELAHDEHQCVNHGGRVKGLNLVE